MNIPGSRLGMAGRIGGLTFLLLLLLSAVGWFIWHHGELIWLDTNSKKVLGFMLICAITVGLRYGSVLSGLVKQWRHRETEKQQNILPEDENRLAQTAPHHVTVTELQQALRNIYGRFWPHKVRILLLTGSAADVEQLAPQLTSQYWQEDAGTVLLWAGDFGTCEADPARSERYPRNPFHRHDGQRRAGVCGPLCVTGQAAAAVCLVAACLLPDTGARNIDSLLNQQILPVLSQQLLQRKAGQQKTTSLALGWHEEDGIVLEFNE